MPKFHCQCDAIGGKVDLEFTARRPGSAFYIRYSLRHILAPGLWEEHI